MNIVRYADRPDLLERPYDELTKPTLPEYMNSNKPRGRYWGRLYTDFPDFVPIRGHAAHEALVPARRQVVERSVPRHGNRMCLGEKLVIVDESDL